MIFSAGDAQSDATQQDFTGAGTLPPGEYVLEAHASATVPFAGAYANKSFDLAFSVTAAGPPQPLPGQVYQFSGSLVGVEAVSGNITPATLRNTDLVNFALAKPACNIPRNEVLALISDKIDHSLRVVVWDVKAAAILAEVGSIARPGGVETAAEYTSIADLAIAKVGRLLDSSDGDPSLITMVAKGIFDPANAGTVSKFTGNPCIGDIHYLDEAGGSQSLVVARGSLVSGRTLGLAP